MFRQCFHEGLMKHIGTLTMQIKIILDIIVAFVFAQSRVVHDFFVFSFSHAETEMSTVKHRNPGHST
jgi:hypothetical protein